MAMTAVGRNFLMRLLMRFMMFSISVDFRCFYGGNGAARDYLRRARKKFWE
jgi:hypothetical protein